jgi:hypothetical protein
MSARLADLALDSGELMPDIVRVILPRLVPVRSPYFQKLLLDPAEETHPVRRYPRETLDRLWAVLADDPREWPYKIEGVLDSVNRRANGPPDRRAKGTP